MMEEEYRRQYHRNHPSEKLVEQTKRRMRKARGVEHQMKWLRVAGAAAAVVVVFGVSVNVSPAFAQAVDEIPVVGDIARVLTGGAAGSYRQRRAAHGCRRHSVCRGCE